MTWCFTIILIRTEFTTNTGNATSEWKRRGTYKKEMVIVKLELVRSLTLERKIMLMMMMMTTTTITFFVTLREEAVGVLVRGS
jgi:hypothetical protein